LAIASPHHCMVKVDPCAARSRDFRVWSAVSEYLAIQLLHAACVRALALVKLMTRIACRLLPPENVYRWWCRPKGHIGCRTPQSARAGVPILAER